MQRHVLDSFRSPFLAVFVSPEATNLILSGILISKKPPNLWRIINHKYPRLWRATVVNPVLSVRIE